jgi:hypothetical protein
MKTPSTLAVLTILASFIARAKYITIDSVKDCLRILIQVCNGFLKIYESDINSAEVFVNFTLDIAFRGTL